MFPQPSSTQPNGTPRLASPRHRHHRHSRTTRNQQTSLTRRSIEAMDTDTPSRTDTAPRTHFLAGRHCRCRRYCRCCLFTICLSTVDTSCAVFHSRFFLFRLVLLLLRCLLRIIPRSAPLSRYSSLPSFYFSIFLSLFFLRWWWCCCDSF
ncbi:hypothetical protein BC567DRAFT_229590 [Phyllosticta citribraziliensis]